MIGRGFCRPVQTRALIEQTGVGLTSFAIVAFVLVWFHSIVFEADEQTRLYLITSGVQENFKIYTSIGQAQKVVTVFFQYVLNGA